MTFTRAIGLGSNKIIRLIVHGLALSKIHPNVLTFLGLVINMAAAALLAAGRFRLAGAVIIGAGLFDWWTAGWRARPTASRASAASSIRFWTAIRIWRCWWECWFGMA